MVKCWKLTDDWRLGNCNLVSSHTRTRSSDSSPPKHLPSPCTGWATLQRRVSVLLGKEGEPRKKQKWRERLHIMEGDFPLLASPLKKMRFHEVFHILSISPLSKQAVQFQAHLHMGHFSAGQCHVRSRLEILFYWHQDLNLVQVWLSNLRSHLSSPLSVSLLCSQSSVTCVSYWSAENKPGRTDLDFLGYLQTGFGFPGLPRNWFLKHEWGW